MRSQTALLLALTALCFGVSGCGVVFGIDEPKHRLPDVCGDGAIAESEACDDGDADPGDGCDAACAIEKGYTCAGEPSVCTQCGNGSLEAGETCDDGNQAAGDGCDATCATEPGFVCVGEPSLCEVCGDGQIKGSEQCDDGNATSGDGCDAVCSIEHGFVCDGAPSVCRSTCGDGVIAANEACDDGNLTAHDGCDSSCHIDHGFTCVEEPSVCAIHCGDGVRGPGEECDDGNQAAGDGCNALCAREPYFMCNESEPTQCTGVCGDGHVVATEGCDDANFKAGDGCDATCVVEAGFACENAPDQKSQCGPVCGDGVLLAGEQCDDGNTQSGDCCSAYCKVEPGCEVEPNETKSQADALASGVNPIGFTGSGTIRGAIAVIGDEDSFALTLAAPLSVVRLETFDESGTDCPAGTNTRLSLLDAIGNPIAMRSDDDSGIGACSALEVALPAGGYYVRVQQSGNSAIIAGYTLEVDVQPSVGWDSGPNNTMATANPFTLPNGFVSGNLSSATDIDFYKVTIPGNTPRSVRAELLEGGAQSCDDGEIQSRLTLFTAEADLLADDDTGLGRGLCSLLDGTGMAAVQPKAHDLLPGAYYLRVMAGTGAPIAKAQFEYRLALTVR
jgi:cysteine-rich repeat protein